jgi:hypothetical protein
MVADTETILIDNIHKPYAAGVMMVRPLVPDGNSFTWSNIFVYIKTCLTLNFDFSLGIVLSYSESEFIILLLSSL